jgi:hypothetical protein
MPWEPLFLGNKDGDEINPATEDGNLANIKTAIQSVLSQLDVALSTRLADATFTTRINTLGQKVSTASTPVVLPSDQSAIPVTLDADTNATSFDLFGRQRVGSPNTLFSTAFLYDKQPLLWDELLATSGTSTFNANHASIDLAVTTAAGSRVVRQSKEYCIYEPGRVQQLYATAFMGTPKANCVQRIGLFDDNNGVFFEQNGTTLNVVTRSDVTGSIVDTPVAQSVWNLDKLNGTGSSGVTIDVTKTNLFVIEFQWLGVGTVRFGIYVGGKIVYCNQIFHANLFSTVYMRRGSLPVRYEIVNTGTTSGATTLSQICCAVQSEAGYTPVGVKRNVDSGITSKTFSDRQSVISIRLKSAYNRATVFIDTAELLLSTGNNAEYQVVLNGTLGGTPSWSSVDANSAVEYDIAGTTVTGGTVIASGYVATSTRITPDKAVKSLLKLVSNIAGTSDIVSLVAQTTGGGNATYFGSLGWREYL